jgi:hypothetical protein
MADKNPLDNIEKTFEKFIERPLQRLFGGRLEPSDIAKHLSRALEDERQVFSGRLIGPNQYIVEMSQEDLDSFKSYEGTLRADLAEYLVDLAERRTITLLGRPDIQLVAKDGMKRGDIHVNAQLVDRAQAEQHTRQFTVPQDVLPMPNREVSAPAYLILRDRTIGLTKPFITLGRNINNDIILEEDDVSREHASIKLRGGHYVLTDHQSANGTRVNGQRITECVLQEGDEVCLAAVCMKFQLKR